MLVFMLILMSQTSLHLFVSSFVLACACIASEVLRFYHRKHTLAETSYLRS